MYGGEILSGVKVLCSQPNDCVGTLLKIPDPCILYINNGNVYPLVRLRLAIV